MRTQTVDSDYSSLLGLLLRVPCLLLTASAACCASESGLSHAAGQPPMGPDRPNFIVIFCDNLGYGDIEPFGSTLHRTPELKRMAREGRKFTHFYATAGVCTPSRASILTGCYAQRIGMHTNPRDGRVLRPLSPYGLHPDEVTIAEVLKQAGYVTSIIGKWHLGDRPEFLPTRHGFDEFHGIPYSDDMTREVGPRLGRRWQGSQWPPLPWLENAAVVEAPVDRDLLTQRCTEQALAFLHRNQHRPFFLYFPQPMPGSTSAPFASDAFKHQSQNGPWGDAIEELDWSTGQILDTLVELGLERRTLVIWTSDNGAPLAADPNRLTRGSNRPLFGRGYTTAEGGFRVPTIFWWPETVPAGSTCDELATTMDILPTCARLAGTPLPAGRILDGHDIGPLILGQPSAKTPYEAFYYYDGAELQAVRSGPWKLFLPPTHHPHFHPDAPAAPQLFQVVDDIGSTTNVAGEHPDVVRRLLVLAATARDDLGDTNRPGKGQRPTGRAGE
jgi:arylsulfatase A-like enzyme